MARLDDGLGAVCDALEAALQAAAPKTDGPYVVLGNPAEANAKYGETSKGRVLVTLAGLRSGAERRAPPLDPGDGRQLAGLLEADLLVTADFPGQYLKGIRLMAAALDWVHDNPVVTAGPAPEASRLTIGLLDVAVEQAASLVDMAGVKGCPFALVRLRGLSVGGQIDE